MLLQLPPSRRRKLWQPMAKANERGEFSVFSQAVQSFTTAC
jgi:hypothetical protein